MRFYTNFTRTNTHKRSRPRLSEYYGASLTLRDLVVRVRVQFVGSFIRSKVGKSIQINYLYEITRCPLVRALYVFGSTICWKTKIKLFTYDPLAKGEGLGIAWRSNRRLSTQTLLQRALSEPAPMRAPRNTALPYLTGLN